MPTPGLELIPTGGSLLGQEVVKGPTISEVGRMPDLPTALETESAVNPHQTLEDLARGAPNLPNLIIDAKGTEKYVPPIKQEPSIPATNPPTEITQPPLEPNQSQLEQNVRQPSGAQSEEATPKVQQSQPELTKSEATSGQQGDSGRNESANGKSKQQPQETEEISGVQQPQPESTEPKATSEQQKDSGKTETTDDKGKQQPEKTETTTSETQQRITELQEKIRAGTITHDELREYRRLKQQENPEARRQALEKKILEGKFTDEEAAEFLKLSEREGEKTENQNPEARLEQIRQEMDELGMDILTGKGDPAENIVKLQELRDQLNGLTQPRMSRERARQLVDSVLNPDKYISRKTAKELAIQREIKARLEELMALEMQVLMLPKRLEALKKQAKQIKDEIMKAEGELEINIGRDDETTFKKRMTRYPLYMQLANVKAEIVKTKEAGKILAAQYKDTMQYVRRKLGLTHGFTAFFEWLDAKLNKIAIDFYLDSVSLADAE